MIYSIGGDNTVRIRLFVRETVPAATEPRVESMRRRVADLAEEDAVDEVATRRWGRRVSLDSGDGPQDPAALSRYAAFAAWATDHGVSIRPFFETRRCYAWDSCRRYDALVVPIACLSVTVDGDLAAVYPHREDDVTYSIRDGLTALESASADFAVARARTTSAD